MRGKNQASSNARRLLDLEAELSAAKVRIAELNAEAAHDREMSAVEVRKIRSGVNAEVKKRVATHVDRAVESRVALELPRLLRRSQEEAAVATAKVIFSKTDLRLDPILVAEIATAMGAPSAAGRIGETLRVAAGSTPLGRAGIRRGARTVIQHLDENRQVSAIEGKK